MTELIRTTGLSYENPHTPNLATTKRQHQAYALHMYEPIVSITPGFSTSWSHIMRTVSIFKNGKNQAIRLPNDMAYEGVGELEITRCGDTITLRPVRPTWQSMSDLPKADEDFLQDRPDVVSDEGRFNL